MADSVVDLKALETQLRTPVKESQFRDNRRADISSDHVFALLQALKTEHHFDTLIDITAIDYLEYPGARDRFGVVYLLLNSASNKRLVVRTAVNLPDAKLPSVCSLWKAANWAEREVYDMFGIVFTGHPDLRRILMPDEFSEYPLRKDYPVKGRGERHNFPVITRAES